MVRASRKMALQGPDALSAGGAHILTWLAARRQLCGVLAGLLLVGLVAAWGLSYAAQRRLDQDSALLSQAYFILGEGIVDAAAPPPGKTAADAAADTPPEADAKAAQPARQDVPHFASSAAKDAAARRPLDALLKQRDSGPTAVIARLLLAQICDRAADTGASVALYSELAQALKPHDPLYFVAAEQLAYAKEADGDGAAALAVLEPLAHDDQLFYADYAQFHQARLHRSAGDPQRARTLLSHLEHTHPNSSLADEVVAELAALGGDADVGGATAKAAAK